jgi:putative ABC transport system permease protein
MVTGRLTRPEHRPVLLPGGMFTRIAPAVPASAEVAAVDLPVQVQVGWVSPNIFSVLGVDAGLGRRFADDEPPGAVMLGDAAWRRLFGADPQAIGRSLVLDGFSYTVVGVLPVLFALELPTLPRDVDI